MPAVTRASRWLPVLISGMAAALCGAPSAASPAAEPPRSALVTEQPWLYPAGSWEAVVGFVRLDQRPSPFDDGAGASPQRDVAAAGLELAGSPAPRIEASIAAGALHTGGKGGTSGIVPADTRVSFGYAILGDGGAAAALAARFTAKVPTAPEDGAAGTDETDVGASLAAGLRGERWGLFGSAGLALLGNPLRNGSQDDVMTYGAGGWWRAGRALDLVLEAEGSAFSRFGNSPGRLRAGCRIGSGERGGRRALSAHAAAILGLGPDAASWGFSLGLSIRKF